MASRRKQSATRGLRLAGHRATDELWPMNVLALWTRPPRRKQALFERYERARVPMMPDRSLVPSNKQLTNLAYYYLTIRIWELGKDISPGK